ncbi:hypothetical protein C8Q74DRAFT_752768 [Fomes fomentarius]|nr:hypothetical protein C8Q74DRAFT_752768 [Fomes fomentarius]
MFSPRRLASGGPWLVHLRSSAEGRCVCIAIRDSAIAHLGGCWSNGRDVSTPINSIHSFTGFPGAFRAYVCRPQPDVTVGAMTGARLDGPSESSYRVCMRTEYPGSGLSYLGPHWGRRIDLFHYSFRGPREKDQLASPTRRSHTRRRCVSQPDDRVGRWICQQESEDGFSVSRPRTMWLRHAVVPSVTVYSQRILLFALMPAIQRWSSMIMGRSATRQRRPRPVSGPGRCLRVHNNLTVWTRRRHRTLPGSLLRPHRQRSGSVPGSSILDALPSSADRVH